MLPPKRLNSYAFNFVATTSGVGVLPFNIKRWGFMIFPSIAISIWFDWQKEPSVGSSPVIYPMTNPQLFTADTHGIAIRNAIRAITINGDASACMLEIVDAEGG